MQGSLAQNSVRWSVFEDLPEEEWLRDIEAGTEAAGTKAERMHQWTEEWEEFCKWVVEEFGGGS
jgi:hypothetical protein